MNRSIITKSTLTEEDLKKKGFHYNSVSVSLPAVHPGECKRVDVPFGPPIIESDPEATNCYRAESNTKAPSHWFFRTDGPSIYLSEDTQQGRYEDDVIMMNSEE
jgi:hypothetical protein